MKRILVIISGLAFVLSNLAAEVVVVFENPDDYRDIDYDNRGNKRGQKIYLPQLEKYIIKQGERYLEEGQILNITFTDIDLAGDYEDWRPPPMDDVRIVKSIYPPRMSFRYKLVDSDGTVLKSGEESISDLAFDYRLRINYHDDLFYDKEMFRDWLRRFSKAEKS